jgi:hypothetical protein
VILRIWFVLYAGYLIAVLGDAAGLKGLALGIPAGIVFSILAYPISKWLTRTE